MVPQLCSTFVYIALAIGMIKADQDYHNYCADEGMEEIEFNNNPVQKLIKKSAKKNHISTSLRSVSKLELHQMVLILTRKDTTLISLMNLNNLILKSLNLN